MTSIRVHPLFDSRYDVGFPTSTERRHMYFQADKAGARKRALRVYSSGCTDAVGERLGGLVGSDNLVMHRSAHPLAQWSPERIRLGTVLSWEERSRSVAFLGG